SMQGRGRSSNLISPSFPSDVTESITPSIIIGEDQEVTSMGDVLCDIFTSQFSHGSMAVASPQDLFGILDFLEAPQEASKFSSLVEDSSSDRRDVDNNSAQVSQFKLPILEQEPEPEPYANHNMNNTFALSKVHQPSLVRNSYVPHRLSESPVSGLKSESATVRKSNNSQLKAEMNHLSELSESETDTIDKPKHKRLKAVSSSDQAEAEAEAEADAEAAAGGGGGDGQRMTHIAVERNRRKQMNEHLAVLRSLMPGFYVQRGDQASIIGGVIEFIKELQQLLQSLESKKQRKAYAEVLSPRPCSSPRPAAAAALSPRPAMPLPISPRTPQPCNSYNRPKIQPPFMDPNFDTAKELVANSKSSVADVEVKIVGSNALLKTLSPKMPGHIFKLVQTLENLSLEILHLNISTIDDTVLNSFTLKIGIECKLSVEELAQAVQQTFSP
ncbi:hypothetical protein KI387_036829, partial [Taxus chinensis]